MMMWFIAWQLAVTLAKERENSQEHDYSDLVSRYNLSDRDLNATSAWLYSYKEQNRKTSLGEGVMVMIWQIMKVHLYWYLLIRWSKYYWVWGLGFCIHALNIKQWPVSKGWKKKIQWCMTSEKNQSEQSDDKFYWKVKARKRKKRVTPSHPPVGATSGQSKKML